MSPGKTETVISKRAEDIRIKIHCTNSAVILSTLKVLNRCCTPARRRIIRNSPRLRDQNDKNYFQSLNDCPSRARLPWTTDAIALQGSEDVKSSHQLLTRLHRLCWIHSAKNLFAAFAIHCCEFAHELIARFPFCVFAKADAEREERGGDPNGNISPGDEKHATKRVNETSSFRVKDQPSRNLSPRILPTLRREAVNAMLLRQGATKVDAI